MIPKPYTSFPLSLFLPCASARECIWPPWKGLFPERNTLNRQSQTPLSRTGRGLGILILFIFVYSSDEWKFIFYQGLGIPRSTQQGVALVSESALRLPEDGAIEGPCRLIPRREILARVEKSHPECLFLEAHSVGPGSLQSPPRSSFLLLIFLLPGPLFCLLSWVLQGAAF